MTSEPCLANRNEIDKDKGLVGDQRIKSRIAKLKEKRVYRDRPLMGVNAFPSLVLFQAPPMKASPSLREHHFLLGCALPFPNWCWFWEMGQYK